MLQIINYGENIPIAKSKHQSKFTTIVTFEENLIESSLSVKTRIYENHYKKYI